MVEHISPVRVIGMVPSVNRTFVERSTRTAAVSTQVLERFIDRHPVHPRLDFREPIELAKSPKCLQKCLLCHIVCILVPYDANGESKDRLMACIVKLSPCRRIALLAALDHRSQGVIVALPVMVVQPVGCVWGHDSSGRVPVRREKIEPCSGTEPPRGKITQYGIPIHQAGSRSAAFQSFFCRSDEGLVSPDHPIGMNGSGSAMDSEHEQKGKRIMNLHQLRCLGTGLAVAVLLAGAVPSPAFAQRDAGAKARGDFSPFWSSQRASRSMRHARDYSEGLYRYSRESKAISPQVAKAEAEELGRQITNAQQHVGAVRAEIGDDKKAAAAVDSIQKHLDSAAASHAKLHAECCKDMVDGQVCGDCCSDVTKELEKAMAEHDALVRQLNLDAPKGSAKAH
jgi:hypothetical protein